MDHAVMHLRLRKDRRNRLRESDQSVNERDQNILDAAALELGHHAEPEGRAFGLFDPEPQHVLPAVAIHPDRQIHGVVPHHALVANLHAHRVQNHDRIHPLERPRLPRRGFRDHLIGDCTDHVRRDRDLIQPFQMPLDLAHRQAARVEREHRGIKLRQAPHALRHQLRRETSGAYPR